jgi:hypothetical protein
MIVKSKKLNSDSLTLEITLENSEEIRALKNIFNSSTILESIRKTHKLPYKWGSQINAVLPYDETFNKFSDELNKRISGG